MWFRFLLSFNMIQSYAIITGASKGIGRAIALELARRGYSLLLIARSATLLEETAALARKAGAAEVRPMALDLTKAESVTAVLQEVQRNNLPVNVLVNNAGYGAWGRFDTLSLEEQDAMMRINMHVPVELTWIAALVEIPATGLHPERRQHRCLPGGRDPGPLCSFQGIHPAVLPGLAD